MSAVLDHEDISAIGEATGGDRLDSTASLRHDELMPAGGS
jgi:hypothetical protein